MKYRLGLDVGTNSLGWSVLKVDEEGTPIALEAAGSRIFSDGRDSKSKATLAADRREARSARRRRDRYKQRRTYLLSALADAGLFPDKKDEEARIALQKLNPLELRARLLTESAADILKDLQTRAPQAPSDGGMRKQQTGLGGQSKENENAAKITKPEYLIGRALFHLNQRRGFQSNRKDRSEETTSGKVSGSVRMLMQEMGLITPPMPSEEYKELDKDEKKSARQAEAQAREDALIKLAEQQNVSFGSFLWQRQQDGKQTRARPGAGDDGKLYDVYPNRDFYKDEFNKIWDAQAGNFPKHMADKARFHKIIFTQRPLKAQKRGKCTYMPEHDRTFRAMPSFQQYRIYQEVNNLEWTTAEGKHFLTEHPEARNGIIDLLEKPPAKNDGDIARDKLIVWGNMKKVLKQKDIIEGNIEFNYESPKRKGFDSNLTSNIMQHEDYVGAEWHQWDLTKQDCFIDVILDDELDDEEVKGHLISEYGLDEMAAEKCMNAPLVEGTASISKEAALLMLEKMRDGIETEDGGLLLPIQHDAAKHCAKEDPEHFNDPHRTKGDDGKRPIMDELPYYGEAFQDGRHIIPGDRLPEDVDDARKFYGGVTNPTVHIALNQIRQVVNELIDRFGHPHSIAIELGRELPEGKNYRRGLDSVQADNQTRNENYNKKLEELERLPTKLNRELMRLWTEQEERCPYCLEKIGCDDLFGGGIDIDHILPRKTLDDSLANKVVCHRECNDFKNDRTPWEAFHNGFKGRSWEEIYENASHIRYEVPYFNRKARLSDGTKGKWEIDKISKKWRFEENAMALQQGDSKEIEKATKKMAANDNPTIKGIAEKILRNGVASLSPREKIIAEKHGIPSKDFSDRHLNDTRYIGRLTREYLENICYIDKIDVLTGRLTALLRGHWGLNSVLQGDNLPEDAQKKKNRDDHRHHAVDAIVIGMTNRSLLQKVATAANRAEELNLGRLFEKNEDGHSAIDPWDGFRDEVKGVVRKITVSHKAKRKKPRYEAFAKDENGNILKNENGKPIRTSTENRNKAILDKKGYPRKLTTDDKLYNDTAYGIVSGPYNKDHYVVVTNRTLNYLIAPKAPHRQRIMSIRDEFLRKKFLTAFDEDGIEGVTNFAQNRKNKNGQKMPPIRSLRCFETEAIGKFESREDIGKILDPNCREVFFEFYDKTVEGNPSGLKVINDVKTHKEFKDKLWQAAPTKIVVPKKSPYKGYKPDGNWGMEIYAFPEGYKKAGKWEGVVISRYDANRKHKNKRTGKLGPFQPGVTFRPEPTAHLVMRLQINDCIEIDENGVKRLLRVAGITRQHKKEKNEIKCIELQEANVDKRVRAPAKEDSLGYFTRGEESLQKLKARKVHISPTGQVNYETAHEKRRAKRIRQKQNKG